MFTKVNTYQTTQLPHTKAIQAFHPKESNQQKKEVKLGIQAWLNSFRGYTILTNWICEFFYKHFGKCHYDIIKHSIKYHTSNNPHPFAVPVRQIENILPVI